MQVEPEAMETSSQQDLERKLAGLRNEVQVKIMLLCVIIYIIWIKHVTVLSFPFFCAIVYGTYNHMSGGAAR